MVITITLPSLSAELPNYITGAKVWWCRNARDFTASGSFSNASDVNWPSGFPTNPQLPFNLPALAGLYLVPQKYQYLKVKGDAFIRMYQDTPSPGGVFVNTGMYPVRDNQLYIRKTVKIFRQVVLSTGTSVYTVRD